LPRFSPLFVIPITAYLTYASENSLHEGGSGLFLNSNFLQLKILASALPLIFVAAVSLASETVIVDNAFNGREIKVRAGAAIQVELKQPGATGYSWEIKDLDKEHFEILNVQTKDLSNNKDIVGAPIAKIWRIKAKSSGKATLKFLYFRSWEGEESAVEKFVLTVRILGAK
jgi:predicted secreted protein